VATAKKKTTKRTTKRTSSSRSKQMRSFRIEKDTIPFTSTKITHQTGYWVLLLAVIVVLQMWILQVQMEIANITQLLLVP
jgi:hypothetical protein